LPGNPREAGNLKSDLGKPALYPIEDERREDVTAVQLNYYHKKQVN
jgi:hypothetical protein